LGSRLEDWSFAQVFTSPLQRARRTAEHAGFGAAAVSDADLMEWDYGAYEGRRTAEIRAERPGWKLFDDGCPGGETLDAIGARADRMIARIRACPGDVLLFAHRDILRVVVARWLELAPRDGRCFDFAPASVSVLGYDHALDEPIIHQMNDSPLS
jgi:probable phosphoglycerate mutase